MTITLRTLAIGTALAIALISIGALATGGAASPPGVIKPGATPKQIQEAIDTAARLHLPVTFDPGTYLTGIPITLPVGTILHGPGATLRANGPISIFEVPKGYVEIHDLAFDADRAAGATAIHGDLLRSTVQGCLFWTNLKYGIDATGQMTFIERDNFGMAGDKNPAFQALRMVSNEPAINAVFIDGNHFYNSGAKHAIEIQYGTLVQLTRNNIERNDTTGAAFLFSGISQGVIQGNYIEDNSGDAQIQCVVEPTGQSGCYVVDISGNWFMMTHPSNSTILSAGGACGIYFDKNAGNAVGGKPLCDNPPAIQSCNGNHVIAMQW